MASHLGGMRRGPPSAGRGGSRPVRRRGGASRARGEARTPARPRGVGRSGSREGPRGPSHRTGDEPVEEPGLRRPPRSRAARASRHGSDDGRADADGPTRRGADGPMGQARDDPRVEDGGARGLGGARRGAGRPPASDPGADGLRHGPPADAPREGARHAMAPRRRLPPPSSTRGPRSPRACNRRSPRLVRTRRPARAPPPCAARRASRRRSAQPSRGSPSRLSTRARSSAPLRRASGPPTPRRVLPRQDTGRRPAPTARPSPSGRPVRSASRSAPSGHAGRPARPGPRPPPRLGPRELRGPRIGPGRRPAGASGADGDVRGGGGRRRDGDRGLADPAHRRSLGETAFSCRAAKGRPAPGPMAPDGPDRRHARAFRIDETHRRRSP